MKLKISVIEISTAPFSIDKKILKPRSINIEITNFFIEIISSYHLILTLLVQSLDQIQEDIEHQKLEYFHS